MTARISFWVGVVVALAAASAVVVWPGHMNHDAAWYLYMVEVLRRGAAIYRDIVDTNPPLIIWLTWPASWLSDLTGLPGPAAFKVYVLGAAAASLVAGSRVAARAWADAPIEARGMIAATIAFCVLPFARGDFGQREHFAVLMTLPYIWLATLPAGAPVSVRWASLAGVVAGLGFMIKPHFVVAWAAIEVTLLAGARGTRAWRRPEWIAAVAAAVVYGIVVLVFVPQYLAVAADVRQIYSGLDSPISTLLRLPDIRLWIACVALVAFLRLTPDVQPRVWPILAAGTGFLAAGLLQFKGWGYHMYPGRVFLLLFLVVFTVAVLRTVPALGQVLRGGLRRAALVFVAGLFVTCGRYVAEARNPPGEDWVDPLVSLVATHAPQQPLAMLSMRTIYYPAFPAVNEARVPWSLRVGGLWFLPGLYTDELKQPDAATRFRSPDRMSALERRWFDETVADLCLRPPGLLLIELAPNRAPEGRRALDLAAYYGQDARFARLFSAYSPITSLGPFAVYKAPNASCQ